MNRGLLLSLLAIACICLVAINRQSWQGSVTTDNKETTVKTELQFTQANIKLFKQFKKNVVISTNQIEKFSNTDELVLNTPTITTHSDMAHWLINANIGHYNLNSETLNLYKNVDITNSANQINIQSSELSINIPDQTIHSDKTVTITHDNSITKSDKMQADLKNEIVTLTSNVETHYEP